MCIYLYVCVCVCCFYLSIFYWKLNFYAIVKHGEFFPFFFLFDFTDWTIDETIVDLCFDFPVWYYDCGDWPSEKCRIVRWTTVLVIYQSPNNFQPELTAFDRLCTKSLATLAKINTVSVNLIQLWSSRGQVLLHLMTWLGSSLCQKI